MANGKWPKSKNQGGFTLLEMLLVVALFTLLGLVIVDVFILALGAQRQTTQRQTTLNGLRFAVQSMASQIRTSQIDFDPPPDTRLPPLGFSLSYELDNEPGIQDFENELYLTGPDGFTYHYFALDNSLWLEVSGVCQSDFECSFDQNPCGVGVGVGDACGHVRAPLTNQKDLRVDNLSFYIMPVVSPFIEEQCSQENNFQCSTFGSGNEDGCSICIAGGTCNGAIGVGFCRCTEHFHCDVTQYCDKDVGLCAPNNLQPMVTINIGFTSESKASRDQQSLQMQTSVVSRVYKR